ncbi:MAG: hypothetical protein M1816_008133 [Peltula sp. TS41687]|nr:MAG: hypothetical protein M1816_008133 [Peltula sp. TS41687]
MEPSKHSDDVGEEEHESQEPTDSLLAEISLTSSLSTRPDSQTTQMEVACEDWNEDFVFDGKDEEGEVDQTENSVEDGRRVERIVSVVVPQSIKERQANVNGDLGHVKDFALLVEELKKLRAIAVGKGIVDGPSAELWAEADDIIDLATSDNDSHTLPPCSPSSAGFGFDPFDEESSPGVASSRKRRKSVLSLDDDFFAAPPIMSAYRDKPAVEVATKTAPPPPRLIPKPSRHEPSSSSATSSSTTSSVARAVIETMHQRRMASTSTIGDSPASAAPKKMPFDSTTLRELVAHVRVLCRRLTELVRSAESPLSSRSQSPHLSPTPSLGQVLAGSVASSPSFGSGRPAKKSKSSTDVLAPMKGKENELGGHILMAVI